MRKILAALGIAVAVPVALAAPALAKPPAPSTPSVFAALSQDEGFRAEVDYTCTDTQDEEGTIHVSLQKLAEPVAGDAITVATASEEAKCDGEEREETIKIPVAPGALQAGQTVRVYTTLSIQGKQVALHTSSAGLVILVPAPSPSPKPTEPQSASPSESGSPETGTPSPSPSASSSPTESEGPESATPSSSPSTSSSPTESQRPQTGTPSSSPSPSAAEPETADASPSPR